MTTALASEVQRKDFGDDNYERQIKINEINNVYRLRKQKVLEEWVGKRVIVTFTLSAKVPNGLKSIKGIFFGFSYGTCDSDICLELREAEYFRDDRSMVGSKEFPTSLDNIESVELA